MLFTVTSKNIFYPPPPPPRSKVVWNWFVTLHMETQVWELWRLWPRNRNEIVRSWIRLQVCERWGIGLGSIQYWVGKGICFVSHLFTRLSRLSKFLFCATAPPPPPQPWSQTIWLLTTGASRPFSPHIFHGFSYRRFLGYQLRFGCPPDGTCVCGTRVRSPVREAAASCPDPPYLLSCLFKRINTSRKVRLPLVSFVFYEFF